MTFKPALWFPIAVVLSVANLVGVGFAAASAEGAHAAIHAGLALLFGLWAQRLGRRDLATPLDAPEAHAAHGECRREQRGWESQTMQQERRVELDIGVEATLRLALTQQTQRSGFDLLR